MAATTSGVDAPVVHRLLSVRAAVVKILSSCLAIAGGGAIGREGPTLQISGAIFRAVQVRLPGFWPRVPMSSMVLAGGAAGLAAAFNTPLGGIVYVIEELVDHESFYEHVRATILAAESPAPKRHEEAMPGVKSTA
jgi:H+/Cl- antiporter ClcA